MTTNQNKAIAKDAAITGLQTLDKADMPTDAQRKRWQKEYKDAQGGVLKLVGAINQMNTQPTRKLSMGERYADIVAEDRKSIETANAQPENVRGLPGQAQRQDWETYFQNRLGEAYEQLDAVTEQRDELLAALKQAGTLLEPLIRKMNIRTHFSEINTFENTIRAAIRNAEQH